MAAPRSGAAKWNGDLKGGSGDLEVGDGVFQGAYTFQSRFEEGRGTNSEELIAAAHAACYSMELSNILAEHGHEPRSVETSAKVELRFVDDAPTITKIALTTEGDVPGLDEGHFHEHAEEAKASCLISRTLAGVGEITLEAKLASE